MFGRNIYLNRGIIVENTASEKLIDCPRYVQDLVSMQEKVLQVSQEKQADYLDGKVLKKQKKVGTHVRQFNEGDLVIIIREVGSKLDYKWKGPYRVVKKSFANVYEIEDLRTKKKLCRDVSSLRSFVCPQGVDPLTIAGQDEGENIVRSISGHRLEGKKKKNKTHWYFVVKFEDETEDWLPYIEVRELQAFGQYIGNHRDFARMLNLRVSD